MAKLTTNSSRLLGFDSLEDYRAAQVAVNAAKAAQIWVSERELEILAAYVLRHIPSAARGVCHGVRTGYEVQKLRELLPGVDVIGTEIAPSTVPHVVGGWDYHESKPEWLGAFDFVYSNSWDHSYDPALMLDRWLASLTPGGRIFLEWTPNHLPSAVHRADCFGASRETLRKLIAQHGVLEADLPVRRPFGWRNGLPRPLRQLLGGDRNERAHGWRLLICRRR
jgi:hypothetical protein